MGRICADPDVKYSNNGDKQLCIARYTLAVDRRYKKDGEPTADFIKCVAFGRAGEFAEKYFHKGIKIAIDGRIQTGSYQNRDGQTVYTTDVIVENQEFAESKAASDQNSQAAAVPQAEPEPQPDGDGFMNIPDNVDDSGLPFNY